MSTTGADELGRASWPAVDGANIVVVPVGALEQHGPHLPLDTDTLIADAVARSIPGVVVAPALSYGASGEHEGFPGTVSIGAKALELLIVEYGRSAFRWANRVLFVNGHGGNGPSLAAAVQLLRYEGRDAAWLPCFLPGADAHAGFTETSLLLHLSPQSVNMAVAEVGDTRPMAELMPLLRASGVRAITPNGILGDPSAATAEDGARLFRALCDRSAEAAARWTPSKNGMIG